MTTFRYSCCRDLISTLGKMDAIVEFAEVATREVLSQAKSAAERRTLIGHLSKTHEIIVDDVDTDSISSRMSQLYLLSAYQQLEHFLQRSRDQHPDSQKWSYTGIDANDLLKRILSNLDANYESASKHVGRLDCLIIDHYRLIRNRFLHSDVNETRVDSSAQSLREQCQLVEDYQRLDAPSRFAEVNFDDYILFTRAIKRLGKAMCRLGRPTDDQIAEMMIASRKKNEKTNLKNVRQNMERLRNKLTTILKTEYSLDTLECQPIVDKIVSNFDRLLA